MFFQNKKRLLLKNMIITCLFFIHITSFYAQNKVDHALLSRFSADELVKLEKGNLLIKIEELANNDILVKAYLIFKKPRTVSWQIISSNEREKEYLKIIQEVKISPVSNTENKVEYVIQWLFIRKKFRLIHNFNENLFLMRWNLDPAYINDLEKHAGYWQLYAYTENSTLAEYAGNMAIKGLPRWFENMIKADMIRYTLTDIKTYIDKQP